MKKLVFGVLLVMCGNLSKAQYYYKDIITNQQVVADMKAFREAKVRTIKIKSFENTGEESEDFFCEKKISKDYSKSELFTKSIGSGSSSLESYFNDKGQLMRTYDSSNIAMSANEYSYDENGRITKILTVSRSNDDDFVNELYEEHIYTYEANSQIPVSMHRVKNRKDTMLILFSADEKGNIAIEKNTSNGGKYYYYYDAAGRLTDIVHSNEYTQHLIADYVFEYNAANQITQMTTSEQGGRTKFIWKYMYENGLRVQERILSEDRKLLGRIEYEYK